MSQNKGVVTLQTLHGLVNILTVNA